MGGSSKNSFQLEISHNGIAIARSNTIKVGAKYKRRFSGPYTRKKSERRLEEELESLKQRIAVLESIAERVSEIEKKLTFSTDVLS